MSLLDNVLAGLGVTSDRRLLSTLASIAALWIVSSVGFYYLLPLLGHPASYNKASVAIGLYYTFWIGIAVITFWPVYRTWPLYGSWSTFENRFTSYIVWSLAFGGFTLFVMYVLPVLPVPPMTTWTLPSEPPELRLATEWYFLPKSVEILFQQLLIVALVLGLSEQKCSLRRISICCAALFGGAHLLLALGGAPWGYVIRFTLSAAAFGLIFPYLLLRVPNGLAYSYIVHWLYYAISTLMPRISALASA